MGKLQERWAWAVAILAVAGLSASQARADGTEILGTPSIDIVANAGGMVAAGTGLETQPGAIQIAVPAGEEVRQVLLYWLGESYVEDDDAVKVNGIDVVGTLIGGPTWFFNFNGRVLHSSYRADITDLGLVQAGNNTLTISDLNYDLTNLGAGVIVIFGDCEDDSVSNPGWPWKCKWCKRFCCKHSHKPKSASSDASDCSSLEVRDGVDLAFFDFEEPREETIAQTFTFAAASFERTADLVIFAGSVGANRPNQILITVNGSTTEIIDLLADDAGASFDAPTIPVGIPAGATSLTVQLVSTESTDPLGASLSWITGALSVPDVKDNDGHHCKPRHHKCHKDWNKWKKSGHGWCRKGRGR